MANGQWSVEEAAQSSTWWELRAVRLVLESLQGKLANERVHWFTDNQNVVRIVQHGSPKAVLQVEALEIFAVCVDNSIRLEPERIPREQNELADYYSRIVDHDDYMLNPSVFTWLDELWGPHSVDRFASPNNAQLDRFNTRFWAPGIEAVDAFTCNWGTDINWLFPPVYLAPRVIRHAQAAAAKGTLIVSRWVSDPFWPLLFPNGTEPADFIIEWLELPLSDALILAGLLGSNLFFDLPNTPMLAVRFHCVKL